MNIDLPSHYFWKGKKVHLCRPNVTNVERKLNEYFDSESRSFSEGGIIDLPPVSADVYKTFYDTENEKKTKDEDIQSRISFSIHNFDADFVG